MPSDKDKMLNIQYEALGLKVMLQSISDGKYIHRIANIMTILNFFIQKSIDEDIIVLSKIENYESAKVKAKKIINEKFNQK